MMNWSSQQHFLVRKTLEEVIDAVVRSENSDWLTPPVRASSTDAELSEKNGAKA